MATMKQKKAFEIALKNNGNLKKAMIASNYSKSTARIPKVLTESKGWKELVKKYLPEDTIVKYHKKLLQKKQTLVEYDPKTRKPKLVKTTEIDAVAVKNALELFYKLGGKFAPEKHIINDYNDLSDEELEQKLEEIRKDKERYNSAKPKK